MGVPTGVSPEFRLVMGRTPPTPEVAAAVPGVALRPVLPRTLRLAATGAASNNKERRYGRGARIPRV